MKDELFISLSHLPSFTISSHISLSLSLFFISIFDIEHGRFKKMFKISQRALFMFILLDDIKLISSHNLPSHHLLSHILTSHDLPSHFIDTQDEETLDSYILKVRSIRDG